MLAIKENDTVNCSVAQLRHSLHKGMINENYNVKWILDKINNINAKVMSTDYIKLNHEMWIGCTILHFVAMDGISEELEIILENGADFTIKNSHNSTVLHQIISDQDVRYLEMLTLNNTLINSVLSAHLKYNNFDNPSNNSGLSHFHLACAANNVELVTKFLENGVSVDNIVKTDCTFFPGFSPLHFTAKYSAYDVGKLLLLHGANIYTKDAKGIMPLQLALDRKLKITSTDFSTINVENEKLLNLFMAKESVNEMLIVNDCGLSHFHVVCALSDSKIAESFLERVVDINHAVSLDSPLWPGYTALHFAALSSIKTVKLIMKNGGNINIKDAKGVTPFDICIEKYNNEDIYAILCLHPNWQNIILSDGRTLLTDLVFAMTDLHQTSFFRKELNINISICNDTALWPGCTPMHLAVIFSKLEPNSEWPLNSKILYHLFDMNPSMLLSQDVHGYTPIHLAFRLNRKPALDLLLNFLERDPNLVDCVDEDGLSYLHIASAKNRIKVLKKLLLMSININAVYQGKTLYSPAVYSGSTALHLAVVEESTDALKELVTHGGDVCAKNVNDMTPIHIFLSKADRKPVDILFSSPNLKNSVVTGIGLSHLHIACLHGDLKYVEEILNDGADVNGIINYQKNANEESTVFSFLKDYDGHSPLICACNEGHLDIVKLLLEHEADVFVKDNYSGKALLYDIFEKKYDELFDIFLDTVIDSDLLRTRLEIDIGMTKLHFACLDMEIQEIENTIEEGVNVNAKIHSHSPIFQGYTPLHLVMHVGDEYIDEYVDKIIDLLLKAGADVTMQAENLQTAIHQGFEKLPVKATQEYKHIIKLLTAQRDFSVNPMNIAGLSHFHIACRVCNVSIVTDFLEYAEININQPIDYFNENFPGYTPLHLAISVSDELFGDSNKLYTVDLLLNHGANIYAENVFGDTPFYYSTSCKTLDVFERLVKCGVNVNVRNIHGNTLLSYLLGSTNVTAEKLKTLLRFGCHLNTFNLVTDKGYLGIIACKIPYEDMKNLLYGIIINFKQEIDLDNQGRTIIHNIVSANSPTISAKQYKELIEKFFELNLDVDSQDNFGQTALHMATKFNNSEAISGLLMVGADINSTDLNGKTALACGFDECMKCGCLYSYSKFDENDKICKHLEPIKSVAVHARKLQLCGFDINKQNEDLTKKIMERHENKNKWNEEVLREIETAKTTKIGTHSLTLYDFLSDNRAIIDYPTMPELKRKDIDQFFKDLETLRKKFPEIAYILHLQFTRARARLQLVELARNAIISLISFWLPSEIVSDFIFVFLKNSDLKTIIIAVQ